jgi:hypothetical protein
MSDRREKPREGLLRICFGKYRGKAAFAKDRTTSRAIPLDISEADTVHAGRQEAIVKAREEAGNIQEDC